MDFETALTSLFSAEGRRDPYPAYDVLRSTAPAFPALDGRWFVTTHALTSRLLRDPGLRVSDAADYDTFWPDWRDNRGVASIVESMLMTNPPDHTRIRRAAAATFTARRVAGLRDVITEQATELIEQMPERADFVTTFAYPLPIAVICALLGVPDADRTWFRRHAADLTVVLEPISTEEEMERADLAGRELEDYFTGLIAERQKSPREDLTSDLASADSGLTGAELLANLVLLLVAGFETTTNLLGTGTKLLLDHPAHADRLRADPEQAVAFVEETLRYDSPVQMATRTTGQVLDLGDGLELPTGTDLMLLLGSANRDPDRYPDPHRFDPDRPNIQPVSFGGGAHYCLGAPLARLEAQVAFPLLLTMLPHLAPAGEPVLRDRLVLRGYAELPVTWG
ncbi:cytochrome P450 [Actinoplanes derwentensis]|uniref:Cytochrome P450 n=1 Tax=Actinoplanes derwentensis TaxID=113562 RepID=A0A1H1YH73_9ACTN|nr:cytochrome P450 [Actinoplanes derwentensis]GID81143.1 cytochrome P450 [Actinoplanes derwentensis]SDT20777.1 Cytochrome P450 [Actinoplanes derwentensis]